MNIEDSRQIKTMDIVLSSLPSIKVFTLILPALTLSYWLCWIVYARFFHPLAKYPGPFLASISRLWLLLQVASANVDQTQRELHKKHGGYSNTYRSMA